MKIRCPECTTSFNVAKEHEDCKMLCPCGCEFVLLPPGATATTPPPNPAPPAPAPVAAPTPAASVLVAAIVSSQAIDIRIRCPDCGRRFDLAAQDLTRKVQCLCGLKFIAGEHLIATAPRRHPAPASAPRNTAPRNTATAGVRRLRLHTPLAGGDSHHRIFFIGNRAHKQTDRSCLLQPHHPLAQSA